MKNIIIILISLVFVLNSCSGSNTKEECNKKYCEDGTDCGFSTVWSQCIEKTKE